MNYSLFQSPLFPYLTQGPGFQPQGLVLQQNSFGYVPSAGIFANALLPKSFGSILPAHQGLISAIPNSPIVDISTNYPLSWSGSRQVGILPSSMRNELYCLQLAAGPFNPLLSRKVNFETTPNLTESSRVSAINWKSNRTIKPENIETLKIESRAEKEQCQGIEGVSGEKKEIASNASVEKISSSKKINKSRTHLECGHYERGHYAKNLCKLCYHVRHRNKKPPLCPHEKLYARGLCQRCYVLKYKAPENLSKLD